MVAKIRNPLKLVPVNKQVTLGGETSARIGTEYAQFLQVYEDGRIWWRLEDAIKIVAGFTPHQDDENLIPVLRAPNSRVKSNERTLIGAFSDDRLLIERPDFVTRDGFRLVDAATFLSWTFHYLAVTKSDIPFPSELRDKVRRAMWQASADRAALPEKPYESLALVLDGFFEKSLWELPDTLRKRVEKDFFLVWWGEMSSESRLRYAREWDAEHDPALKEKRAIGWEAYLVDWGYWKTVPVLSAQEFCILRHVHDPRKFEADRDSTPGGIGKTLGERVDDDLRICARSVGEDKKLTIGNWISWSKQQSWSLPVYLRAVEQESLTEIAAPANPGQPCDAFLAMEKLDASELTVSFVGDKLDTELGANNMVEISARNETRRVALAVLGLVDRRRGTANSQCLVLLGMTLKKPLPNNGPNTAKMKRLRDVFRKHLGIHSDPFEAHRPGAGWVPRFKLLDKRGAADERAKREAERRTDSFEQLQERGNRFADAEPVSSSRYSKDDDADSWLEKNDPDFSK